MTCEKVSIVCEIVARPLISWTILGLTFLEESSVAQVWRKEWKVKPESRLFQERLELPMVEVVGVHRLANPIRKHEVVIFPKGAQAQPFFVLTSAVALEGFYGLFGELDRAAALVALGRVEGALGVRRPLHR